MGAILSQYQEDDRLHPVAYQVGPITKTEANHVITTLVVVWAVTHFRYYQYGHKVTIITDHAAVRVILGAPNLSGMHGAKFMEVVSKKWKSYTVNAPADCLSRQPVLSAPADEGSNTGTEISPQITHISSKLECFVASGAN